MKKLLLCLLYLLCLFAAGGVAAKSDAEVKQAIIQESISSYPGNCPCPYNTARNGSKCGKRSAYSKPGGYAPICYERDVSKEMVEEYQAANRPEGSKSGK